MHAIAAILPTSRTAGQENRILAAIRACCGAIEVKLGEQTASTLHRLP